MIFTSTVIWQIIWTVGLSAAFASLFEWILHRFVMHKSVKTPFGKFEYPFKAHAVVHHQTFRSDHTYHLIHEKDKWTIPMAWWNGLVLTAISTLMFWPVINLLFDLPFAWVFISGTIACYYLAYEYMHWCMHLPSKDRKRLIESVQPFSWILFRLNGHHILHHRYMHQNFNVVLPLADLMFGTLLLRSKAHFKQPTGPMVPNVQPKGAADKDIGVTA